MASQGRAYLSLSEVRGSLPPFRPVSNDLLQAWWIMFQQAMVKANAAMEAHEKRLAYLLDYNKANRIIGQAGRDRISNDWERKDFLDDWSIWTAEAKRYKDAIDCATKMAEIMRESPRETYPLPRQSRTS